MKIKELKKVAEKMWINPLCYCLKGGFPNECYTIGRNGKKWEVYYSERGNKSELEVFDDEWAACERLYRYLKQIENTVYSNESVLRDQKPHKIPKEWWITGITKPHKEAVEIEFNDRTVRFREEGHLADPYDMIWVKKEDRNGPFLDSESRKDVLDEADRQAVMDAVNDYYRFRSDAIVFWTKQLEEYAYELADRVKKNGLWKSQAAGKLKKAFMEQNETDLPYSFYADLIAWVMEGGRWYKLLVKPYKPELKDLWFRKALLADEKTMTYNEAWGGTIDFPEEDWQDWYDWWLVNDEGKRYYRYLVNEEGEFVGEMAYHYSEEEDKYMADVIVMDKYRKHGYGSDGIDLLCSSARENGVKVLYDNIAVHNPAYLLFRIKGFEEESRTDEFIYLKKEL